MDPHLTAASFLAAVERDKVSPQLPFLQIKQPRLPQLLLIKTVPQDPWPALLPLSGHASAPQFPSCVEDLKTEHRIWGGPGHTLAVCDSSGSQFKPRNS